MGGPDQRERRGVQLKNVGKTGIQDARLGVFAKALAQVGETLAADAAAPANTGTMAPMGVCGSLTFPSGCTS